MTKVFKKTLPLKALIGFSALCLVAVACGADDSPSSIQTPPPPTVASSSPAQPSGPQAPSSPSTEVFNSVLPNVEVVRIATNEELLLSSLTPSDRPLLLWFWAPH
jgi:hypothetical protein